MGANANSGTDGDADARRVDAEVARLRIRVRAALDARALRAWAVRNPAAIDPLRRLRAALDGGVAAPGLAAALAAVLDAASPKRDPSSGYRARMERGGVRGGLVVIEGGAIVSSGRSRRPIVGCMDDSGSVLSTATRGIPGRTCYDRDDLIMVAVDTPPGGAVAHDWIGWRRMEAETVIMPIMPILRNLYGTDARPDARPDADDSGGTAEEDMMTILRA